MIADYELRPPSVRAVRFTGDNISEVAELLGLPATPDVEHDKQGDYFQHDFLGTGPADAQRVSAGDYVLRYAAGDATTWPASDFEATYRVAGGPSA